MDQKSPDVIAVKDLSIAFKSRKKWTTIVDQINFSIPKSTVLAIVGESGSGKSVTAKAIMGLLPLKTTKISGQILFNSFDITNQKGRGFRYLRGKKIGMVFQEPMSALNPSMKLGSQVLEVLLTHEKQSKKQAKDKVLALFKAVGLSDQDVLYNKYPHQISGGQKQRVVIAMAIACKPDLLIADEPTTALDVTVQRQIIDLLIDLQNTYHISILFISHDLALVSQIADKILVLYQGRQIEYSSCESLFRSPKQTYTKALLESRPNNQKHLRRLPTVNSIIENSFEPEVLTIEQIQSTRKKIYQSAPILRVVDIHKQYITNQGFWNKKIGYKAIDGVSFDIFQGETKGLVGESGCGKSTLANLILGLDKATSGHIYYKGDDITLMNYSHLKGLRKDIQVIFQDPYASLNPKMTVGQILSEPLRVHKICKNQKQAVKEVKKILFAVGLDLDAINKYPHEFSGGQKQRIGIARAISLQPKIIICDESVSALDISIQAQVLNLLNDLKDQFGFTYLFISHDLSVVRYMSDEVLVINKGKIEEKGQADELFDNPKKAYTKRLIDAIPKGIS